MAVATGRAGIVSPHVPVRKNSQQRAQGQIGKKGFNTGSRRTQRTQRMPRGREEIRRGGHELVPKNGAGFGDIGVKGFDDGGVLLLDNAALEFEREGDRKSTRLNSSHAN